MNTLTNEELKAFIQDCRRTKSGQFLANKLESLLALESRVAELETQLAEMRGQDAILQVDWGKGWHDVDDTDFARYSNARGICSRKVYANPVPPAASQPYAVPDEIDTNKQAKDLLNRLFHGYPADPAEITQEVWNACRAAMLQLSSNPESGKGE
ncbi:hypothetical protein [Pectobacterium versatile]|uniref:hypothetical protein n=1 Tax=Pectobacterium versatile TaxID=2488639 RepID=UPI0030166A09